MINHEDPEKTCFREFDRLFNASGNECWLRFMEWNKAIEGDAGFLKNDTVTFELKIKVDSVKGLNPNSPKICEIITVGRPIILKTSGAIFFLASQKQCDTHRFWIYFYGSAIAAKKFSYTLSIAEK